MSLTRKDRAEIKKRLAARVALDLSEHPFSCHWLKRPTPRPTAEEKRRKAVAARYYEGGHRMILDGAPCRVAAFVKKWKKVNREALCQGRDLLGLVDNAPRKVKYGAPEPFWGLARLHGDLFHRGPAHQEAVAAEYVGEALQPHGYRDCGGGRTRKHQCCYFESDAAEAIGWALQVFGFDYCGGMLS